MGIKERKKHIFDRDSAVADYLNGVDLLEIVDRYNISSKKALTNVLRQRGVYKKAKNVIDCGKIKALYMARWCIGDIAEEEDLKISEVEEIIKKMIGE